MKQESGENGVEAPIDQIFVEALKEIRKNRGVDSKGGMTHFINWAMIQRALVRSTQEGIDYTLRISKILFDGGFTEDAIDYLKQAIKSIKKASLVDAGIAIETLELEVQLFEASAPIRKKIEGIDIGTLEIKFLKNNNLV